MTAVIDASVAVKWVLPEAGSERAAALRAESESLVAPSLVAAEVGSAIWRAVARGDVRAADAVRDLRVAVAQFHQLVPLEQLAERALELANQLRHPIYDCFYLALAERERAPLITADDRLLTIGRRIRGILVQAL
jgi:predicted nucleic acid-binding protein